MVRIRRLVYAVLIVALASIVLIRTAAAAAKVVLPVLCWHDIRDASSLPRAGENDLTTVSTRDLVSQFEMIRVLGYTPISLSQWQAALEGRGTLPPKPVLLSFDDGFKSLYTRVFPLLKMYRYPALASIVTEWMEPDGAQANSLVSWEELREMSSSGLLEVASHTHAMHSGVIANPQGNELPAGSSRIFSNGAYESDAEYQSRLLADLQASKRLIQEHLGFPIQTLVWPYGEYSQSASGIARRAGFTRALGLSPGVNTTGTSLMELKRTQVLGHQGLSDILRALQAVPQDYATTLGTLRTLSISLDDVYHPVAELQELRLANLLETVRRIGVNTVIVRSWSETAHADGSRQFYFPSRNLPMKADLLSRATWQLRHRSEVQAWVEWPAQQREGFEDLGKHVSMSGIVLQLPSAALDDIGYPLAELETRLELARGWRPDLVTAVALQIESGRKADLSLINQSINSDFLIVRGAQDDLVAAALPTSIGKRPSLADGRRRDADRLILEAISTHNTTLDTLLATGARHIGYQAVITADLNTQVESLWPRLSTATLRRPRQ